MKDRFKKAYDYLVFEKLISNQQDLASIMKYSRASISKAMNGYEGYLTESFLRNFNESFNNVFNIHWLLTGEGDMLKPTTKGKSVDSITFNDTSNSTLNDYLGIIKSQQKTIETLSDTINKLITK